MFLRASIEVCSPGLQVTYCLRTRSVEMMYPPSSASEHPLILPLLFTLISLPSPPQGGQQGGRPPKYSSFLRLSALLSVAFGLD